MKTEYPIIIGGQNFGCGSSREHAPVSLGASGTRAHGVCVCLQLERVCPQHSGMCVYGSSAGCVVCV